MHRESEPHEALALAHARARARAAQCIRGRLTFVAIPSISTTIAEYPFLSTGLRYEYPNTGLEGPREEVESRRTAYVVHPTATAFILRVGEPHVLCNCVRALLSGRRMPDSLVFVTPEICESQSRRVTKKTRARAG